MNSEPNDGLLIIGYGNPLRGDDGAGVVAARRLRVLGFQALELHQLTPEIAEPLAAARTAIFIDADTSVAPGRARLSEVAPAGKGVLEHHASPAGILRLAVDVYGCAPKSFYVGLGGEYYGYANVLTESAEHAVAEAIQLVVDMRRRTALAVGEPISSAIR